MSRWDRLIAVGTLLGAMLSAGGTLWNAVKLSSIQARQTDIQNRRLILDQTVVVSQEIASQNKQTMDLFPLILSKETRQRALALQLLKRAVPNEVYSDIVSVLVRDPDRKIRIAAIMGLGRSSNKRALTTLNTIINDSSRPAAERGVARQSVESVTSNNAAVSACDLNSDGVVDAVDIQIAKEEVLGLRPCTIANTTVGGKCTVVELQRVIRAALGHPCLIHLRDDGPS